MSGPGAGDGWSRLARGRVRPTRRAGLHLLLGGLLYVAGANVGAGWVVAIAGLALGAVPWAAASAVRAAGRVEVRRRLPDRAVAGVPARVALEVRTRTAASVVLRDDVTGAAGATGDARAGATLAGGASLPRGVVGGGRVEATVTDLFGLVRVAAAAEVPGRVEVLPPVPAVRHVELLSARAGGDDGAFTRTGHGTEVVGVREHAPGMPLRAVHWRSTARRGQLVVRDLAGAARPRLRIVVAPAVWSARALDVAAAVACGVAEAASATGQPVEVAADGTVAGWGPAARRHLATLPPHAGAPPRPLADAPPGGDVEVRLAPAESGVRVTVGGGRRAAVLLGVLPATGDVDVGRWLSERLAGGARPAGLP